MWLRDKQHNRLLEFARYISVVLTITFGQNIIKEGDGHSTVQPDLNINQNITK